MPNKFTHIIITFTDGSKLFYNDVRKFGWLKILNDQEVKQIGQDFGVEPLSREFTLEKFTEILATKKNWPVKKFLLDQSLIAGLGNIYADESCFLAHIRPARRVRTLKPAEIRKLHQSIVKVLKLAITKKGTTSNNFVQLDGSPGGFVRYLKVYGRTGERCRRCSGIIKKVKLVGRGTHYCANCQK